jgi:hypothetical protein
MRLTATTLSAAQLAAGKREQIFFDDKLPGFGLRVREGGSRTFVFQYQLGAKQRRMSLGVATESNVVKSDDDAHLLAKYLSLFLDVEGKPNVRQFAREQAKEKGVDPDAMERKVWRVLNDEDIWAALAEEGHLHCPWPFHGDLSELSEDRREFLKLWWLLPVKQ